MQPFVVAIDTLGNPIAMARPSSTGGVSDRIIQAQVANLIWNARTVLADQQAQKTLLDRTYAFLSTTASSSLSEYYKTHSPFGSGATVSVHISSVLPVSKDSTRSTGRKTSSTGLSRLARHRGRRV